jgi:hypothetical protein
MPLREKLPGMADDALGNLHANAVRLGGAGSAAQRASATELLPAIEAEMAARKVAKRGRQAEARKATREAKAGADAKLTSRPVRPLVAR